MPAEVTRGFPEGFGRAPDERRAALVLATLRGITPRKLHELAWREGSAAGCLDAIRAGRAGTLLNVDTNNTTPALHVYESVGMRPVLVIVAARSRHGMNAPLPGRLAQFPDWIELAAQAAGAAAAAGNKAGPAVL